MKEHEKARAWRKSHGLTLDRLSELTGYTRQTIWWMEQGMVPADRDNPKRQIKPWVWMRYRNICAAVDQHLRTGATFNWKEKE